MTNRVFDCQSHPPLLARRPPDRDPARWRSARRMLLALLAAGVLVPIAGAAEAPQGWWAAGLTALAIVLLLPRFGEGARWGWLVIVSGGAGVLLPRGSFGALGPALAVATGLCLVVWLFNRASSAGRERNRPREGSPEREAQRRLGLTGERQVGQVLARELPHDFVLINGLKLPRGAGDIDHLVVGPTGVFLIETKTMAGRIVCEPDGRWHRTRIGRAGTAYSAYIGNPAAQVQRNIFAVRESLRKQLPGLFRRTPLWIEGLVVFPHPRTELATVGSRVPAVHLEEAAEWMCSHVPQRGLRPAEIERIVAALLAEADERTLLVLRARRSAQSVVEVALALPVVLALVCGIVGLSRMIQAQAAIISVAHEAARAGALASNPDAAAGQIRARAADVAGGLGLDANSMTVDWDLSQFYANPAQVVTVVRYSVDLRDLPLAGWVPVPSLRTEHAEWVDPFRGGMRPRLDGAP